MVNASVEGKTYPETDPYLVGREKIREFALAVVIQERSLSSVLADKEADIDFSRVVHGDQRFIHARPIVAGDELTSQLTVASVKTLGAHAMVTFETKIHDANKQLVCTAISTLVVRGEE
jgi:hypothetical protein